MSIHSNALIVTLQIGAPPQTKAIKHASEEVEDTKRMARKQASVVTKLFAKDDVKDLVSVAGAARKRFKELTLPWDRGAGLVPTVRYMEFLEEMRTFKTDYDAERQRLINDYADIMANAAAVNGDLFNSAYYPHLEDLKSSMYFSIEATPVPSMTEYDKLAGLTPEELEKLKEEAVLTSQNRTEAAVKDLFSRLLTSLEHAAKRLSPNEDGTTNIFRDSLVDNIHKAIEAAETLNILDDEQIKLMVDEVKKALDGVTAGDLRRDLTLRQETAGKVETLAKRISEFI